MANSFIPLSVPSLKGNELKYVTTAIQTEWVSTAGPYVEEFEQQIASYVGTAGAVSCQNGTSGIHLALLANNIGPGSAVLVPALTFIAAVNPVKYVNASPVFLDCDDSLCIDPHKLMKFCQEECFFDGSHLTHVKSGLVVKALILVHVFGNMADLVLIKKNM